MLTKIVYFRPDKRFVKDDDLNDKYTCLIKDEFTTAESSITVPAYLTVLQHYIPKSCMKTTKKYKKRDQSSNHFQEKLCFYLIGSKQAPPLHDLISTNVDRIEFQGHIGFEQPIFEILNKFPRLRKVTFSINPCKQRNFVAESDTDDKGDKQLIYSPSNMLVTNVNILVKRCRDTSCCNVTTSCRKSQFSQNNLESSIYDENNDKPSSTDDKEDLETMIVHLLQRMPKQCPNIKRLTMDVPKYSGLRKVIENAMQEMGNLKPTKISSSNDRILVCQGTPDVLPAENESQSTGANDTTISIDDAEITVIQRDVNHCSPSSTTMESAAEDANDTDVGETETITMALSPISDEQGNNVGIAEPINPCLFDMSKLLGSMLGIPTSTIPSSSAGLSSPLSSSSSSLNVITSPPSSPLNTISNTNIYESSNLDDFQPLPSITADVTMNSPATNNQHTSSASTSPTVEVITYAAAAASATATTANTTNATTTCNSNRHYHNHHKSGGNDIGSHHHRNHHHINEGSRRTFLKDGEGPGLRDEEESARTKYNIKSNKTPSIPHVADLGKPVVVISSSSCKSPHKRNMI